MHAALTGGFDRDAAVHLAHPFEDLDGPAGLYEAAFAPLHAAVPDLERRDTIVIAGNGAKGSHWVGCGGYYTGTFLEAWLDIPPTRRQFAMRFHEFFRVEEDRIIEPKSLTRLLVERCKGRPLVVLLDEAQNVRHKVGHALLNASQSVAAASPFMLVMAGTPELQTHLDRLLATFWNRAKRIGIGRLSNTAAAAAVANPLDDLRPSVSFVDEVLETVVAESQCYPYFLQLWGDALWQAANDAGTTRVDDTVVSAARPAFDLERTTYYEDRCDELKRQGLLEVAARIAPAFRARAAISDRELDVAIEDAMPAGASSHEVHECQRNMANVGYVWKAPGAGSMWQPGIRSLMDYVGSHAR